MSLATLPRNAALATDRPLRSRTNGGLVQTFTCDPANELTNITRIGNLTLSGSTAAPVTNLTVNGLTALAYGDLTFAATNLGLNAGQNSFTNIARNTYGTSSTNIATVNLPSAVVLQFDGNGNLTNDGTRSFVYDAENRLVTNFVSSAWKTEFVYDGLGRRRIERDYGWSGSWSKTNELHFIYDGWLLVQVRDGSNNVLVTYTRGLDLSSTISGAGGIGGLLARTDGNGSTFYHADGSGNITALIDGSQIVKARYEYSPFGRLVGKWGPMADLNEMQFSSVPAHRVSGLVLYPFRPYDPYMQRWLNRDPIGEAGAINLYQFVGNNPISNVDPYGLMDFHWYNPISWFWPGYGGPTYSAPLPLPDPNTFGAMHGIANDFGGETGAQVVTDIGKAVLESTAMAAAGALGPGEAEGAYQAADEALQALRAAKAAKCAKFAFKFKTASPEEIYRRLALNHGIDPALASERLHAIKAANGFGAADNVVLDLTGNVYNPGTGEWIGSLTAGGAKVH